MLILYAMLGYAALIVVILILIYRLTRTKEALFAARREAVRDKTQRVVAKQAAEAAEERCMQMLAQVETSLAQTGQALQVAGHIEVVSQQIHGLIEYIAGPLEEPPGRHALANDVGRQAINDGIWEDELIP